MSSANPSSKPSPLRPTPTATCFPDARRKFTTCELKLNRVFRNRVTGTSRHYKHIRTHEEGKERCGVNNACTIVPSCLNISINHINTEHKNINSAATCRDLVPTHRNTPTFNRSTQSSTQYRRYFAENTRVAAIGQDLKGGRFNRVWKDLQPRKMSRLLSK
jgi:hypothetical protein